MSGTAVSVGYNNNLENLIPGLCETLPSSATCIPNGPGLVRSNYFVNDGRLVRSVTYSGDTNARPRMFTDFIGREWAHARGTQ